MPIPDPPPLARVLFVANHFPPVGGGGVQRAVKFARLLPEFGVEPVVLTGPGRYGERWAPDDPTMLAEVAAVEVVRTERPPPGPATDNAQRADRLLGRRSAFANWWVDSIVESGQAPGEGVDVILGELVPYETAFGVEQLARRLGIPWVADLQDPWALDEMWLYPSAAHRLADRARMRRTLRTAAAVIMNTPEAAERLVRAFPEFRERRVLCITNGYDAADFAGAAPETGDGIFRIVHSGYLHTGQGLRHRRTRRLRRLAGGMPMPGIDFLTRSHVFLMEAVERVIADDPSLRERIEVELVGVVSDDDRKAAEGYPFVRFFGYRSHAETVAMLRAADLLFLPMHDLPAGTRAGLIPGKTFEYLAAGKPILAAVPEGDARDLLLSIGTATVCRPAAVDCLTRAISERIEEWRNPAAAPRRPDAEVLARYERRELTRELAGLLVEVAGKRTTPAAGNGA